MCIRDSSIAVAFAEENATTTTTTTTSTAASIDLSVIIPIINQLLPVFLIIAVISALFKAFRSIAAVKIHRVPTMFSKIKPYLPAIFTVAILCVGIVAGVHGVVADEGIDMSDMTVMLVSLMTSLMPLLFILMIFKALMSAIGSAVSGK